MYKKSEVWVSVIIYTLVALLALVVILGSGIPILVDMKDRAVFTKTKDNMLELDRQISELAGQSEGSQVQIAFDVQDGELFFKDDKIIWEIESKSDIMSSRSSTKVGNLVIASNANVEAKEYNDSFFLKTDIKNDTFLVKINKKGTKEMPVYYSTSDLIDYVSFNGNLMDGNFSFKINDISSSINGTGYTEMMPEGNSTSLGRAKVIAHMNTVLNGTAVSYDLEFTLESYADFLIVNVKNFKLN